MSVTYFDAKNTPIEDTEQLTALEDHHNSQDYSAYDSDALTGISEIKGRRPTQEDRCAWGPMFATHTPDELAQRLYLSYIETQTQFEHQSPGDNSGSTASTTLFTADGKLITATLGDAMSYLVIRDKSGNVRGARRLNQDYHSPKQRKEKTRIEEAGGHVVFGRVEGGLAVSRAFGDRGFRNLGVTEKPSIDINDVSLIAKQFGLAPEAIGDCYVVAVCDGVHDVANSKLSKDTPEDPSSDEGLIKEIFESLDSDMDPREIACQITKTAFERGSTDNISAIVHKLNGAPGLINVFDGHGGTAASTFAAQTICGEVANQMAYGPEDVTQMMEPHRTMYEADLHNNISPEAIASSQRRLAIATCVKVEEIISARLIDNDVNETKHAALRAIQDTFKNIEIDADAQPASDTDPVALLTNKLNNTQFEHNGKMLNACDYLSHDHSGKQILLDILACIATLGYSLVHGIANYSKKGYFDNGVGFFKRTSVEKPVLDSVEHTISNCQA